MPFGKQAFVIFLALFFVIGTHAVAVSSARSEEVYKRASEYMQKTSEQGGGVRQSAVQSDDVYESTFERLILLDAVFYDVDIRSMEGLVLLDALYNDKNTSDHLTHEQLEELIFLKRLF